MSFSRLFLVAFCQSRLLRSLDVLLRVRSYLDVSALFCPILNTHKFGSAADESNRAYRDALSATRLRT